MSPRGIADADIRRVTAEVVVGKNHLSGGKVVNLHGAVTGHSRIDHDITEVIHRGLLLHMGICILDCPLQSHTSPTRQLLMVMVLSLPEMIRGRFSLLALWASK